jgi:hypothetical protein
VRIGITLSFFIARTTVTASPATTLVLARLSGSLRVEENTTLGSSANLAKLGSSSATMRDMVR